MGRNETSSSTKGGWEGDGWMIERLDDAFRRQETMPKHPRAMRKGPNGLKISSEGNEGVPRA